MNSLFQKNKSIGIKKRIDLYYYHTSKLKMTTNRLKGFLLCCLFFALSFFAQGQNFKLQGRILDFDTRENIEGATVTLRNTQFGDVSNGAGVFLMENVLSEKYTLAINYPGYNTFEQVVRLNEDIDLGNVYLVKFGSEGTGSALQKTIRATNVSRLMVDRPNFMGNTFYGIPPEPKKVEGNFYLDNKWNLASILLYREQTVMEGFRVRYNINSNMFELWEPESSQITTIQGLRIQNIVWMDSSYKVPRYFVNGMDFRDEEVPISGFFEVLVEGELPLMRRTIAVFKESNYNTALMVGNRNDQIIKRELTQLLVQYI